MIKKRIIIVGAGPAGIAASLVLSKELKEKAEIILIDQGKRIEERTRDAFDKNFGFGGVGAYSDGKFVFENIFGNREIGTNLHELIGQEKEKEYLIKAKLMFKFFYRRAFKKDPEEISEERIKKAKEIQRIASQNDMNYILARDYHVGTDKLPFLIKEFQKEIENNGVILKTNERVIDFEKNILITEKQKYNYDYLLIAPGRHGCLWLDNLLKKKNIAHSTRPIDIGFRIEVDAALVEHLSSIERDMKLEFRHPNGDLIRTFCSCPYGVVVKESAKPEFSGAKFNLVNGMSNSKKLSDNTNFALLVRMPLRDEARNNIYGQKIAEIYYESGIERPVLQRLGDLKMGRSSKKEKMNEWRVKPTLRDVTIGDVRIGMPARIMDDILYGIKKLSVQGLMHGLDQDSTLLYGPEIKFHGIKILTDEYLQSISLPGIYFAGDGTGFSRGIGGAMASGIRAAEGILRDFK
ncbi:MAG: hypothetical protein QXX68_01770 [Candidatus Pacearchaeota archaeon]